MQFGFETTIYVMENETGMQPFARMEIIFSEDELRINRLLTSIQKQPTGRNCQNRVAEYYWLNGFSHPTILP
jgi:hypothetical protein